MRVVLFLRWLIVLAVVAVAAVTVHPDALGLLDPRFEDLTMRAYVAQAIAMRPLIFLAVAALALLTLLIALVRRVRARHWARDDWSGNAPRRSRGRATFVLGLCLALVAGAHGAILASRGLDSDATLARGAGPGSPRAFTVLTYNTLGAAVTHAEISDLMATRDVDVAVLPETNAGTAERVQQDMAARGRDYTLFTDATTGLDHSAIAVLVADELGEFSQSAGPPTMLASIRLEPEHAESGAPTIVAVHPIAPAVGRMQRWRDDVAAVTDVCRAVPREAAASEERLVIAGDFNATLDHRTMQDLGGCTDAATQAGTGAVGTWPTSLPALAGAAIDHVLIDSTAWRATASEVVDAGDSDHRGVLVRLEAR